MAPPKKQGVRFPDRIIQELRNMLCAEAREMTFGGRKGGKVDGAKVLQQEQQTCCAFHGTEGCCSILDKFLKGHPPHAECFEERPMENNREGMEDRMKHSSGRLMELIELFHCNPGKKRKVGWTFPTFKFSICVLNPICPIDADGKCLLHKHGFTRASIASTINKGTDIPLTGRNIIDRANKVIANFKFAWKFYDDHCDSVKNEPSGKKLEDGLLHIRQQMFLKLRKKDMAAANKTTGFEDKTEEDMDPLHFFTGYFAFVLCGADGLAKRTMSCLSPTGEGVEKCPREQARKEAAEHKTAQREEHRRGVGIKEKASAAHLAQSEHSELVRTKLGLLAVATQDRVSLLDELKQCRELINESKEEEMMDVVADSELVDWKKELSVKLGENRKRKDRLQNEIDQLLQEPRKKQVTAFLNQVGDFTEENRKKPAVDEEDNDEIEVIVPLTVGTTVRDDKADDESSMTTNTNSNTAPVPARNVPNQFQHLHDAAVSQMTESTQASSSSQFNLSLLSVPACFQRPTS